MNIDIFNKIKEIAETKPDGVYRRYGHAYKVEDSRVTHVSENDEVLQVCGAFMVNVGLVPDYNTIRGDEQAQKFMKKNLPH